MLPILALAGMISFTVIANLLLKQGAIASPTTGFIFDLVHWKTSLGFAFFACAGLLYAWALKFVPLNVAQCFTALQFVGVILVAALVLSEPISIARWLGIVLIACGIFVVGFSESTPPGIKTAAPSTTLR